MDILPHEKQIQEYEKTILQLKSSKNELFSLEEVAVLEKKLKELKERIYERLDPWERVQICRHPMRPHTVDYIEHLCDDFVELFGDRVFADDKAIVGGLGTIDGVKCMIIGQEKGNNTEKRLERNFGMPHPEGFRKALRLMKMAEKFHLPVVVFVDTPGAMPNLAAEERGQGFVIAENLKELSRLKTPVIVVVIGEAGSGGALAIAVGDMVAMLEHSYYSVISPEGCASILWKDASKREEASRALKFNSESLLEMKIVDQILKEPLGGAHHDPKAIYQEVKGYILEQIEVLKPYDPELLIERRYMKFRSMGQFLNTTAS